MDLIQLQNNIVIYLKKLFCDLYYFKLHSTDIQLHETLSYLFIIIKIYLFTGLSVCEIIKFDICLKEVSEEWRSRRNGTDDNEPSAD